MTGDRQVHLGTVVSITLWVIAWVVMILAAVFDEARIGWPGMALVGMASVSSARTYLAQHDRHMHRAIALSREREEVPPPGIRRVH